MEGQTREEREKAGFDIEELYYIASEIEEIPSFRLLSRSHRWFSWRSDSQSSSFSGGDGSSGSTSDDCLKDDVPKVFNFQELQKATDNFSKGKLLAHGGFSQFYKGRISKGNLSTFWSLLGTTVAVKKFLPSPESLQAYETELHYLRLLHHPNIIKLIGSCAENDHRLLVYEYMPNGNLSHQLSMKRATKLSWTLRLKIAIQIASVLSFLHGPEIQITHQLVSPASILLDEDYNAKLIAFGLAKTIPTSEESKGPSAKYDVYCFGIVLLVLLSGRTHSLLVVDWESLKWQIHEFMDQRLAGQCPEEEAYAVGCLALRCTGTDPQLRPNIEEVLRILEGIQAPKNLTTDKS